MPEVGSWPERVKLCRPLADRDDLDVVDWTPDEPDDQRYCNYVREDLVREADDVDA